MFVARKISKKLVVLVAVAAVVLAVLTVVDYVASGQKIAAASVTLSSDDDLSRAAFLEQYGWEITTVPLEVCEITVPKEFDSVYQTYNDLQLTQGFDLREFAGCSIRRYTYCVNNYPDNIENVRANILQYGDKIIGGDICTTAIDGFIHGFAQNGQTGIMKETMAGEGSLYDSFSQDISSQN